MLEDDFLKRILRQLDWAGRRIAGERALDAVRTGLESGMSAGLAREVANFATAIIDPDGGKIEIRQFLEETSPPLPVRRDGVWLEAEHETRAQALQAACELLPAGAPFFPGVTAAPPYQYAFGIARDPETGAPARDRFPARVAPAQCGLFPGFTQLERPA